MASRNRLVNAVYSASFYLWFPLVRLLPRVFGRPFLYALARQTVGRFFRFRPKYLRAVRSNFAHVFREPPDSPRVVSAAREMIDNHSYHWIDFFHFAGRPLSEARRLVAGAEEYEKILAAVGRGRGVVLATAHLGNWYIGGFLLGGLKNKIHVVYKPDRFPIVEKFRSGMQRRWGVSEIPVGHTMLSAVPVIQALSDGQIVAMQCDRDFNNTGVAVNFFGGPAYFPRGPFVAAMATGAVFLPSFVVRQPDHTYRVLIEEPLEISRAGPHEEDVARNVERFVRILERYVARYPTQWYCFYPFWDDPTRKQMPARKSAGPPRKKSPPAA